VIGGAGAPATGPVPPRRLRSRAGVPGAKQYAEGGRLAAAELAGAYGATGRSLASVASMLDFGCGAGRVLPHFARLVPGCVGAGCDVDAVAIAWAQEHLPAFGWSVSSFAPPLPYPSDRFALVYSVSVFSHLGAGGERAWLTELRRVLVDDGVAMLSVHGANAFEEFRCGHARTAWCRAQAFERGPLGDRERAFVPYVRSMWTEGDLPGIGRDYGLAFHGARYVAETWGRELEVIAVLEQALTGWQDIVVCRKRPV
jgi:SAM-dependent methyltransferase